MGLPYAGFSLSAMFRYYGGHVMRVNADEWSSNYGSSFGYRSGVPASALNYWTSGSDTEYIANGYLGGSNVVGVSLDSKKEAWLKAIKDLTLPWPQMSDLKGWESAASAAYNIKGIPFTLLVAQDGTIVGRNIWGENLLEERIAELLK